MPRYRYRGINTAGKMIAGTQTANSLHELESRLDRQSVELIRAKECKGNRAFILRHTVSRRDLINFCFHLEQLVKAGVPLIESLKDLRDSLTENYLSEVVNSIVIDIEDGKTFSEALKSFPKIFSNSFVSLIGAGERSGELSQVLFDLSQSLRWQDELISQTKKAVTYPAFVAVVVIGVIFFLMIYLVPQLLAFITSMHKDVPLQTKVLIFVSDMFVRHWDLIIGLPLAMLVVTRILHKRSRRFRFIFDDFKLRIWIIGPILKKIILARFTNYFALLFNAGIPVIDCLKITEGIVDNALVETTLKDSGRLISTGERLSNAFQLSGLFPPLVIRMVKVGENSGNLTESMQNVSYFFKRDVDEAIDRMQSLIEPVLTAVLGLILGWVMLSVLSPIYDLLSQIPT